MLKVRRNTFYTLFIVVLLTTEFFYIEIAGGVARIYHFLAVLVVLLLAGSIPSLLRSKVFIAVVFFAAINFLAALLSDEPSAALVSLMSNYANIGIVTAVALILLRGRLSGIEVAHLVLFITILSVLLSIAQMVSYQGGLLLALSDEQELQVQLGFGPAFRTEANTFGKYLVLPFLLFLPMIISGQHKRVLQFAYMLILLGILMNFTRTALYGILIAILYAFVWYLFKGGFTKVMTRYFMVGSGTILVLLLITSGLIPISDYARHKIDNFFDKEEILEGGSSAYRIEAMEVVLENTLADEKRLLIGNGWGQTYYDIRGEEVQAGGGDLINVFGYSGILGVTAYLAFHFLAFFAAFKLALRRDRTPQTLLAEGVLFSMVGMFFTGQMSGYLIAPEFYLLLGICVYFSLISRSQLTA